ncbi:GntR family transcriptional regulator [Acrocarpospora sp. B8E8]|uniref:GntR family transcriptional regulator n=1 Tax=Acrocarpospora sp. B8E8 TaxID=3153572 RepID=UPI00325E7C33
MGRERRTGWAGLAGLGGTPEVNRDGPDPLYMQIADVVAGLISGGSLGSGEAVPSEAELRRRYRIAAVTARRVHRELRERGLVFTVAGEGTFVGRQDDTLPASHLTPRYQVIAQDLAARIRAGEIAPGRRISSQVALRKRYGVGLGTVRHAMSMLREAGWVSARGAKGTFAAATDQWPDPEVWHKMIAVTFGAGVVEDAPGDGPPDVRAGMTQRAVPR